MMTDDHHDKNNIDSNKIRIVIFLKLGRSVAAKKMSKATGLSGGRTE